ncbi:MAG: VOC family protein [Myxococcales bacterium]|jgi:uncharacterized glyoxalase superfamily protein PhnB
MQPIEQVVPMVVTDKVAEAKAFYTSYFDFEVSFDAGWYVALRSKSHAHGRFEIAFRAPREGEACFSAGLSFGLQVASADAELAALTRAGVPIERPIADNPWGDRSFFVRDPAGVGLYVFHPIEMAPEYSQYAKS